MECDSGVRSARAKRPGQSGPAWSWRCCVQALSPTAGTALRLIEFPRLWGNQPITLRLWTPGWAASKPGVTVPTAGPNPRRACRKRKPLDGHSSRLLVLLGRNDQDLQDHQEAVRARADGSEPPPI